MNRVYMEDGSVDSRGGLGYSPGVAAAPANATWLSRIQAGREGGSRVAGSFLR
jgi:hypothetical protein